MKLADQGAMLPLPESHTNASSKAWLPRGDGWLRVASLLAFVALWQIAAASLATVTISLGMAIAPLFAMFGV